MEQNSPNANRCYASDDVSERDDMGSFSLKHSYDSSSTSSSERFRVNAILYNTIAALEDDDIGTAPTVVADFFREYKDSQEFIQANLDYRDSRNTSNNVVHLLITKRSDFVIPALQEILQYDRNLIEETNDDLQTPFSIAIAYNATVYMLNWLYKICPSNAEVMNSVGVFPEELLAALYPYSFQREELPKDLLYRIHIAASIGPPNGFLRLLLAAKPDDIPGPKPTPLGARPFLSSQPFFEATLRAAMVFSESQKNSYYQHALQKYSAEIQERDLQPDNGDRANHIFKHTRYSMALGEFRKSLLQLMTHFNETINHQVRPAATGIPFPELENTNALPGQGKQILIFKRIFNALYHLEEIYRGLEKLDNNSFESLMLKVVYLYPIIK